MVAISSTIMEKEGKWVKNVQLISNDTSDPPKFQEILEIAYKGDPNGALSSILSNILMMNDVRNCYMCKIEEVGDLELREAYGKLYDKGLLKSIKLSSEKG